MCRKSVGFCTLTMRSLTGPQKAAALMLAQRGCNVVINYTKSQVEAEDTAKQCRDAGAETLVFQGDVGDDAVCQGMAKAAFDKWGRIDTLVNNAWDAAALRGKRSRETEDEDDGQEPPEGHAPGEEKVEERLVRRQAGERGPVVVAGGGEGQRHVEGREAAGDVGVQPVEWRAMPPGEQQERAEEKSDAVGHLLEHDRGFEETGRLWAGERER